MEQYVKTGKVRFGFVQYAFLGQESTWAAEASECADEQGAFWPYHDLLFEKQSGENQGAFTKDKLKGFAADLKLNQQTFAACLDSDKYADTIAKETQAAQALGVPSTPSFIVNDKPIVGAEPFSTFQQLIEADLSSTK